MSRYTQPSHQDEFMTPANVAQQADRTNQTPEYTFGANLRRMESKIERDNKIIRRLEEKLDRTLALLDQLVSEKENERITGEYPAVKLFANLLDGKVYWSVKGGPYMKHGASIWPEVLEPAGFGQLQPTEVVDLAGWTAVYTAKADGSNPKVTQLIPPQTAVADTAAQPTPKQNPELTAAALWRQEAIACTEAFMFDTAVTKAIPYYTDSAQVEAARTAICGPWHDKQAKAALLALETYADKVTAPSKRPIPELKQAALTAARQTYNKESG